MLLWRGQGQKGLSRRGRRMRGEERGRRETRDERGLQDTSSALTAPSAFRASKFKDEEMPDRFARDSMPVEQNSETTSAAVQLESRL